MTPPAQRDWAAFTDCGDGADDSADSAIYFRPGRMAGDTHKVRAIVDVGEKLDVNDEAAPDGAPAPHRSNTVKLVTWRRIPIVATWIVGARTTPITTPPLTAEYKKAALLIEPAPGVAPQDIGARWAAEYKTIVAEKAKDPFLSKALESDLQGYPVRFREFMDYWELTNPDAGFFGVLWERIRNFFGASDEQAYKEKCDDAWYPVTAKVTQRIPIPDDGITAVKFGRNGPHNQNPKAGGFTAGVARSDSRFNWSQEGNILPVHGLRRRGDLHPRGRPLPVSDPRTRDFRPKVPSEGSSSVRPRQESGLHHVVRVEQEVLLRSSAT